MIRLRHVQAAALGGLLFALAAFAAEEPHAPAGTATGPAEAVDGDTLRIAGDSIRIHGIDAPETDQHCIDRDGGSWACGRAASARMAELVAGHRVVCEGIERDRYDRLIARCTADGRDVARVLVAEGLAWAYRQYSDAYVPAESAPRRAAVGIWQADNEPPWSHRRAQRAGRATPVAAPAAPPPDPDCRIKGNIARSGEMIYHLPRSPHYGRTRIDTAAGERWFCTEAAAVEAGWRAPLSN